MTPTGALALFAATWIAIGFGTAYFMVKKGHDIFTWWYMGAVLGPLAIPMAVTKSRQRGTVEPAQIRSGTPGSGMIDVLVGVDGSAESKAAIDDALELLGPRVGRLCLASVEDFDAPMRQDDTTSSMLERMADALPYRDPSTVVLTGKPAVVLLEYAAKEGYELLAVGSRGHGMAKALLGSVAQQLAKDAPIPVLISRSPSFQ